MLGTLEKNVMEILWRRGESCVKDIIDIINYDRDISYSTVITVTNRMVKKGLLTRKKSGKTYFYKPVNTKEQFLEIVSKKVVEGVSGFSLQTAMVHFIDYMTQLEPEKIEFFSRLIESKRKNERSASIAKTWVKS